MRGGERRAGDGVEYIAFEDGSLGWKKEWDKKAQ